MNRLVVFRILLFHSLSVGIEGKKKYLGYFAPLLIINLLPVHLTFLQYLTAHLILCYLIALILGFNKMHKLWRKYPENFLTRLHEYAQSSRELTRQTTFETFLKSDSLNSSLEGASLSA